MKVVRLDIKNFRAIKSATIHFDGHTLLIGGNNVGKSTICEALELVLGVDRLRKFPPVEEFDFYNAKYLDESKKPPEPISIEVEVVLVDLPDEVLKRCVDRLEFWHATERRLLGEGENNVVDNLEVVHCLRIKAIARYNIEDDEFEAQLVYCSGPFKDNEPQEVQRNIRQLFGFLYLRTLRTGSRALSLERGSLLDVILQQRQTRTGIWEIAIKQLRKLDPPIDSGVADLGPILENIEKRLGQYIPLAGGGRTTSLFVSQLTREHLRKTISFFLKTSSECEPVPFQDVGTGTLNILVLALLSFLAESRKDSVIFAMEEPEIAIPPHTQRRIAKYLLDSTTQCFITSHSPYVIEQFDPEQIQILRRDEKHDLVVTQLKLDGVLKAKTYRKHARRAFAEALLGKGVIVGEGITERDIILAVAEKLESADPEKYYPLDVAGVTVITVDGDGALHEFGKFFSEMRIDAFGFYDSKKTRKAEDVEKLKAAFKIAYQTPYAGAENLLTAEIPVARLWQFLEQMREAGENIGLVPGGKPSDDDVRKLSSSILRHDKGSGHAAFLIGLCKIDELPATVVGFLQKVYALFPRPEKLTVPEKVPPADENPTPPHPDAGVV